jgi:hypothetical protein
MISQSTIEAVRRLEGRREAEAEAESTSNAPPGFFFFAKAIPSSQTTVRLSAIDAVGCVNSINEYHASFYVMIGDYHLSLSYEVRSDAVEERARLFAALNPKDPNHV